MTSSPVPPLPSTSIAPFPKNTRATIEQRFDKGSKTRAYLKWHVAVNKLYPRLKAVKEEYLTDEESRGLGIQFSGFDLLTGETSESTTSFFWPNHRKEYNIAETGVESDDFTEYPNSWMERLGKAQGWLDALVDTYVEYGTALCEKFQPPSDSIITATPKAGHQGAVYRSKEIASIHSAEEFLGGRSSHRVLVMSSTNRAEENRITVSELDMLLSWMLGGMHAQIYALCKGGVPASEFHMIFPVLVISFLMPTHARLIQGYFQDGKLKIQFTKLYDFNVSHYTEVMNSFLQWADPVAHGDTVLADKSQLVTKEAAKKVEGSSSMRTGASNAPEFGRIARPENTSQQSSSQQLLQRTPHAPTPSQSDSRNTENVGPSCQNH